MRALFVLALAVGLLFESAGVRAQDADTRGLVDRLDRLERDLNTLQSQVYRGQTGQAAGDGGGSGGSMSGNAYSLLDDRITALETQLQNVTGQVEKANFGIRELSAKIERMQADNDFRFKELEAKAGITAAPAAVAGTPVAGATGAAAAGAAGGAAGSEPQGLAPAAGFLVHHGAKSGPEQKAAQPSAAPTLVGKTPQEQYDYAFGLLRNSDYDAANAAFQAFIAQHPRDPLAGNAMYWRGQIPYSQGRYDQAAVIFLDVYEKYRKSPKAGESLLKVGLSMSNLGKKKDACAALHRFSAEFPDAAENLKRQSAAEKRKLGC